MAGIDKIYGTNEQYDEFWEWCSKNKKEAIIYFYPRGDYIGTERAITNFPEEIDMWLIDNCPIKFVIERIKAQYGMD